MTTDQIRDPGTVPAPSPWSSMRLGEIVTSWPDLARELERHGLDYCCGGTRTLREACDAAGLDSNEVATALAHAAGGAPASPAPWSTMGMAQLVDHLESTHHRYLWDELPRLTALAERVAEVHGGRHPELTDVLSTFVGLRGDLEPHLRKEEQVLFPMIRELATADRLPDFAVGSVANPISVMLTEHDRAGDLLARLRESTNGYATPPDGCASYDALYRGLERLEADTHLHVHKENNVLFPTVVAVERRLANRSTA